VNNKSLLLFPIKRALVLFSVISGKIGGLLSPFLGVPVTKCPLISVTDFKIRSVCCCFNATNHESPRFTAGDTRGEARK
jgi:hypothetical protein